MSSINSVETLQNHVYQTFNKTILAGSNKESIRIILVIYESIVFGNLQNMIYNFDVLRI